MDTFDPESGCLLSTWKVTSTQEPKHVNTTSESASNGPEVQKLESSEDVVDENSPPAKRRKLSTEGAAKEPTPSNGTKAGDKGPKKGNKRSDAVASGLQTPAVILLEATTDGRHVIVVTGEDKAIRVFQCGLDGREGHLKELSRRYVCN